MPPIQIRNFRNSDLEAVTRLAHRAFCGSRPAGGWHASGCHTPLRGLTSPRIRLLTRLLRYRLEMIVAEVDGNVAGFMMLTGRDQVNMNTLMVDPQYRRCGIGAALMEEASTAPRAGDILSLLRKCWPPTCHQLGYARN